METINELALFAGVGGGLLASRLLGWRTVCAVEKDEYASRVLMQRQDDGALPPFPIWDDIHTFDGTPWRGLVDVISGGFPCQAFSTAARGRNVAADLWPEMLRVVGVVEPRFVFAENVSRKAIDTACDDLEALGYETRAIALSASDVGADHVRKRYWLLAYTDDKSKLLRGIDAKMALSALVQHRVWSSNPGESGMAHGMANRVERFRAVGNGQVPLVAVCALLSLCLGASELC